MPKLSSFYIIPFLLLLFLLGIFVFRMENIQNFLSAQGNQSITESPLPQESNSALQFSPTPSKYADKEGQLVHKLLEIEKVPSPKGVAFTPNKKEIWATMLLNGKRGVSVFDAASGKKIRDINLENGGGVEIIFNSLGTKAYVSQMETAKVFEIDTFSKEVVRMFDTRSSWTKVLELSKDSRFLFASNWVGDDISLFNLETGKLVKNVPTVDTPRGLYSTQDGKTLYVAGFGRGEIEKIDIETGKGEVIFKSGGAMRHIAGDEDKGVLYVSDMAKNTIWKVSLSDGTVSEFAKTDRNPNTIALSPDKKVLFVSCRGRNATDTNYYIPGPEWGSVLLFDTETGRMLDAIVGGNQPTALDISRDGSRLAFSNFLDGTIEVFEVPPYTFLKDGNGGRSGVYKEELQKR